MARKTKKRRIIKTTYKKQNCFFCETKTEPDYKDYILLAKFLNIRGGLAGRKKTGTCSRHQRALAIAVKRARHLALLPFVTHPGA